jgi:hypothetical protein
MDTIQLDTQGALNTNIDSTLGHRKVVKKDDAYFITYVKKAGKAVRSGANKTSRIISKYNPYEWWFNLSTRRRATRRAKREYTTIVRTKKRVIWDDTVDDYGTDGHDGTPTIPPIPDPPLQDPLGWDPYNLEIDEEDWNREPGDFIFDDPKPLEPKYKRGGRAQDLAYAIELQFGKLPYDKANHEVARRFASRHDLVENCSVRYAHRAALVKRALHLYFVTVEADLIDHFVMDNPKNDKRTKQLRMARW